MRRCLLLLYACFNYDLLFQTQQARRSKSLLIPMRPPSNNTDDSHLLMTSSTTHRNNVLAHQTESLLLDNCFDDKDKANMQILPMCTHNSLKRNNNTANIHASTNNTTLTATQQTYGTDNKHRSASLNSTSSTENKSFNDDTNSAMPFVSTGGKTGVVPLNIRYHRADSRSCRSSNSFTEDEKQLSSSSSQSSLKSCSCYNDSSTGDSHGISACLDCINNRCSGKESLSSTLLSNSRNSCDSGSPARCSQQQQQKQPFISCEGGGSADDINCNRTTQINRCCGCPRNDKSANTRRRSQRTLLSNNKQQRKQIRQNVSVDSGCSSDPDEGERESCLIVENNECHPSLRSKHNQLLGTINQSGDTGNGDGELKINKLKSWEPLLKATLPAPMNTSSAEDTNHLLRSS